MVIAVIAARIKKAVDLVVDMIAMADCGPRFPGGKQRAPPRS